MISQPLKDDKTQTFKSIKKLLNKQEILSRNLNFTSIQSLSFPFKNDTSKSGAEKSELKEKVEKVKNDLKEGVEKTILYCKHELLIK
jgi:hypothetical protein